MNTLKFLPVLLCSSLLIACGSDDKGPALPQPGVLSSSSSESSQQQSSQQQSSQQQSSEAQSSSAPALEVAWNVYDGNDSPFAAGALLLGDGSASEFTQGGNAEGIDQPYFTVVGDGTLNFDTSADVDHRQFAQFNDVVANNGVYPKKVTLLAGVTGPSESGRVLDFEIAMADDGETGSMLKAVIRADNANTGVQLERADNNTSVQNYTLDMLDTFHVYHITVELTDSATGNVNVYVDGSCEPLENLSLENVTMRTTSGAGNNYLRFGDNGGNSYKANIDWVIWTNEEVYTPDELTGALPENIGEINGYDVSPCDDDSGSSSSSSSSLPDITEADYDFEADTLGAFPVGFVASNQAYAIVSDEQARSGSQSVRLTRYFESENVNLRRQVNAADTGSFKVSVFIPSTIHENVNTYLTLWDSGYTAVNNRVADLVLGANGGLQNRGRSPSAGTQGPLQAIEDVTINFDQWNDYELTWTNISTSGEYTLTLNGVEVGTFEAEFLGRIPNRFEIKYGAGNSTVDADVHIYVDAISAF